MPFGTTSPTSSSTFSPGTSSGRRVRANAGVGGSHVEALQRMTRQRWQVKMVGLAQDAETSACEDGGECLASAHVKACEEN